MLFIMWRRGKPPFITISAIFHASPDLADIYIYMVQYPLRRTNTELWLLIVSAHISLPPVNRVTKMSSENTPRTQHLPGKWTEIVRQNDQWGSGQALTWSDAEQHYIEAIQLRTYVVKSMDTVHRMLRSQYREWLFSVKKRKFVARTRDYIFSDGTSKALEPFAVYPEFSYVELHDMFERNRKSVPEWVVKLMAGHRSERILLKVRPEVVERYCGNTEVGMTPIGIYKQFETDLIDVNLFTELFGPKLDVTG